MRVVILFAALVGCANVAEEPAALDRDVGRDVGDESDDTFEQAPDDASFEIPDYGAREVIEDTGVAIDGGTCAARVDACEESSIHPFDRVLDACDHAACGNYFFDVDAEGCVTSVTFAEGRVEPSFQTCVLGELAEKRFPCIAAGRVRRYLSCTVK